MLDERVQEIKNLITSNTLEVDSVNSNLSGKFDALDANLTGKIENIIQKQ